MKPLDLIFYKGNGIISKFIRWKISSAYSHVGLVFLDEFHIAETDWKYPLKIRHLSYKHDNYDIYKIPNLNSEQKNKITDFINITLNSSYDWDEVLNYLGFHLKDEENKYICISWVDKCLEYAGIKISKDIKVYSFEDIIEKYGLEQSA